MKPTNLAIRLSSFLGDYLPNQRNVSPNTIKSYSQAFSLLIVYCRDIRRIPPHRLTLEQLTPEVILEFLDYVEHQRKCSVATRNHRLAPIHSFFLYVQGFEPELLLQCQRILAIQGKRVPTSIAINYLSPEQMKAILAQPDLTSRQGRRDATMMSVLYDAALRVQELIMLCRADVRLEAPAQISVIGKGRKRRAVPLLSATVELIQNYLQDEPLDPHRPLFRNRQGRQLTRAGVRYVLKKYTSAAGMNLAHLSKDVSPHTFRHSKAMHLLQSGNPLVVIQSFLGHANVQTTTTYAKADLEMTRAALEKASTAVPAIALPSWIEKPDILAWLHSL